MSFQRELAGELWAAHAARRPELASAAAREKDGLHRTIERRSLPDDQESEDQRRQGPRGAAPAREPRQARSLGLGSRPRPQSSLHLARGVRRQIPAVGRSRSALPKVADPMNYAPLDPKDTVILFADLQAGIIELGATNEPSRLRRAVAALAKLAKLFEIPAIVTTAPAEGGARVTPEIAAALGQLPQHERTTTDAFTHDATRDAIVKTGRKTLLVAGVATEVVVQHSPCRVQHTGFRCRSSSMHAAACRLAP